MNSSAFQARIEFALQHVLWEEGCEPRVWKLSDSLGLDGPSFWEIEYELESIFGAGFVGAGAESCDTFGGLILWATRVLQL